MAVDRSEIDVPEDSGNGGTWNRRNLLILAAVLGGAAGLFFFLMRRNTPTVRPENEANTSAGYTQTDLQLGNIAQQLLQFRGEQSIAEANEVQRDAAQRNWLLDWFGFLGTQVTEARGEQTAYANQQAFLTYIQAAYPDTWQSLWAQYGANWAPQGGAQTGQGSTGAGGFSQGDSIALAEYDAGYGLGQQWYPLMSAAPVRRIA